MRYHWLVLGLSLVVTGCASVTLPSGPDIYSMARKPNAVTIIVAKPEDQRIDKVHIGNIGATQYSLKTDPTELLGKEMVAALYKENINGILGQFYSGDSGRFAQEIQNIQADGLLALSVKSISIKSFDILMDPPTAEVTVESALHDRQGKLIETASATGHVQRRISAFSYEKEAGDLIGEAIHDAAQKSVDGKIGQAIKKLAETRQ